MGTVERLDNLIEQERLNLGIEFKELAALAGIAPETLRALRKTGKASALTKRRVEDAIRWVPGSIDTVLAGGEPTRVDGDDNGGNGPSADDDEVRRLRAQVQELRAEIKRLSARKKRTAQENDAQHVADTES